MVSLKPWIETLLRHRARRNYADVRVYENREDRRQGVTEAFVMEGCAKDWIMQSNTNTNGKSIKGMEVLRSSGSVWEKMSGEGSEVRKGYQHGTKGGAWPLTRAAFQIRSSFSTRQQALRPTKTTYSDLSCWSPGPPCVCWVQGGGQRLSTTHPALSTRGVGGRKMRVPPGGRAGEQAHVG